MLSDTAAPDTREGLICKQCGRNARVRAALGLLIESLGLRSLPPTGWLPRTLQRMNKTLDAPGADVYVTEQVTPTYVWMQQHLGVALYGGEFEPSTRKRIALSAMLLNMGGHGKVVFRDVTALDFAEASLDAVVSFDVLEHVPDYPRAIAEFARVLRPGGTCIATFPFNDQPHTLVRAELDDSGQIHHIEPPEYHGDPISGGILCYYHFGWDVLDVFREAGFREASMVMPYSLEQGLPYGMWTLLASR